MPSWLAGVAMSTTSVAVVYAVMIEFGFNTTDYGKTVLAACFITDLGTVVALGLIFAPFTHEDADLPRRRSHGVRDAAVAHAAFFQALRQSAFRSWRRSSCCSACSAWARWPRWADSEAVLPAYLIGMVLAGTVGKDHALIRRLRTLTFGLLTPFYFIRAGSFVSMPA